jgi:hypothetical protein
MPAFVGTKIESDDGQEHRAIEGREISGPIISISGDLMGLNFGGNSLLRRTNESRP